MADDLYDFEFLTCGECGIRYAVPRHFIRIRREDSDSNGKPKSWHCPNGHPRIFRETELDRVKRDLDLLRQNIARVEDDRAAAERAKHAAEAKLARVIKRSGAGVCQCCNRTFQQLARHMKSKHPEIVPIDGGRTKSAAKR